MQVAKMAAGGQSEKASLGIFAKSQTRYGTTTKARIKNETFVKHLVSQGETLQGIALKYGVSVSIFEDICRKSPLVAARSILKQISWK